MALLEAPTSKRLSQTMYNVMQAAARLKLAEPELLGLGTLVRPGDQVFDVGAAYGMYTLPLAHLVGASGGVHAFEPQPGQQRVLRLAKRLLRASQVDSIQAVLGSEHGRHTLLRPTKFGIPVYGHAHVEQAATTDHQPGPARRSTARMHTVDSWCDIRQLSNVSFIKMDVEGFEPEVLAGATETIAKSQPSMLIEIENRHISRYGRTANEFAKEIRSRWPDYGMYTWSDDSWKPVSRIGVGVRNYLFATSSALERR